MMRRLPILPTLIVAIAVAAMVALGFWQLQRRNEKEAAIASVAANLSLAPTAFPATGPVGYDRLYRRSSLHCLRVVDWQTQAGQAVNGKSGYGYIAHCTTGAEGPGAYVLIGIGNRPDLKPRWSGGQIAGRIAEEPDHRALITKLIGTPQVLRPMLIAAEGHAGLVAPAPPSADSIPNNHLAYAVQWFLFAAVAIIIYIIAVLRRSRPDGAPDAS